MTNPSLDQKYSALVDQLTALNNKFNAFVNGKVTDSVALDNGTTVKSLTGVIADISKFSYVQKIVDQRTYNDMIAADSTVENGLIVRIWGDTPTINGLYLKKSAGVYSKISYTDLHDLTQPAGDMDFGYITDVDTGTTYDMGTIQ